MIRLHITIKGKVQGVFFRANTKEEADKLHLTGWVRNLPSGNEVEVVVEGKEEDVYRLVEWCHSGPSGASVGDVKVVENEYRGEFTGFVIKY